MLNEFPSIGFLAQTACIWEATARKPGNVHRYRDFHDATYLDFLLSAAALASVVDTAPQHRVGETVLNGIRACRKVAPTNINLGIFLLLAPLAAVPADQPLRQGLARVLDQLDVADSRSVYHAIRLAAPAGLGRVAEEDIQDEPRRTLRQIMALAAERDLIARQYADGFQEILEDGVPALQQGLDGTGFLEEAIVFCHLHLMAKYPDSLIARKRGIQEATEVAQRARQVLALEWPQQPEGIAGLEDLDAWLRAEGNSRNPGTTADLVAASLFVALREGTITLPSPYPWTSSTRGPKP
jgi:triphosphoribosyl-dephospho-CoA synthase